jgi:hypothetical protein
MRGCLWNRLLYPPKPSVPAYVETEAYKKGFIWGKISGEKDRNRGTDWLNPYSPHPITGVGTMEQYLAEQAGYTSGTSEYGDFIKGYEDGYYYGRYR